jgi:hypothetical protein
LTRGAIAPPLALALACVALASPAWAQVNPRPVEQQAVQLAPLASWGFGGSVRDVAFDESRSFEAAPVFGGALDLRVGPGWNAELFYSRQETRLKGGLAPPFDVAQERYLLGIQQETGDERVRWFGTFYLGATRWIPGLDGYSSDLRFTGGIGLGAKAFFTKNVGLRFEARGFYTLVKSDGGMICANGTCLFAFSGSGLWQGDVGGGLILAF